MKHSIGAGAGLLMDLALGEPPLEPHPVAAFGTLMQSVEGKLYRDSRSAGVAHAIVGVSAGSAAGLATGSATAATYIAVAPRELHRAASVVHAALTAGDLDGARAALPSLVGRDPSRLKETEIARAVVESVAENTVDGVIAPAFFGALAGAPGAAAYRGINTLDSMVGHHGERYEHYGWASARLDDVVNWVPARLTAALVAAVRPRSARAVLRAVRSQAPAHPSPNAGVAEAAFAAALRITLGGPLDYHTHHEDRPLLGDGPAPQPGDIPRAIALSRDVTLAAAGSLLTLGVVRRRRSSHKGRRT